MVLTFCNNIRVGNPRKVQMGDSLTIYIYIFSPEVSVTSFSVQALIKVPADCFSLSLQSICRNLQPADQLHFSSAFCSQQITGF